MATKYLSVSIKGSWDVTCTYMLSALFRITFRATTFEGSFSVIAPSTSEAVTEVISRVTLVYVWKSRVNAELSNWIRLILMSIEWRIVMPCFRAQPCRQFPEFYHFLTLCTCMVSTGLHLFLKYVFSLNVRFRQLSRIPLFRWRHKSMIDAVKLAILQTSSQGR